MTGPVGIMRRKPTSAIPAAEGAKVETQLKRSMSTFQLTCIGVGSTVGTGIFFIFSEAVPTAGPAVIFSFVIAAITAGLTALCYAELASSIPASGSTYTYAYTIIGEFIALLVGACLILEYGVSTAAVSVLWSQYLNDLLDRIFGVQIPEVLSHAPGDGLGFGINLPAMILVALCAILLIRGTSESARVNAVMVVIKIGILAMFAVVGFFGFDINNLEPFAPFGVAGIGAASGLIFFSFIGLDAVSTAGEEVNNPKKALPIALISALLVVTVIYLTVTLSAIGAQPQDEFAGQEAGLSAILEKVTGSNWPSIVLSAGAVISIFSVTLVTLYGQTRVLFAVSRDGLIPEVFSEVNPRSLSPVKNTIIVAIVVALMGGFIPLDFLADLVSMGTLVAFMVVSVGVVILRRREPDLERGFKVPLYPVLPLLSVAACIYLITQLKLLTWFLFAIWLAATALLYFTYSRKHSRLNPENAPR
ncbi:amino acid permease [Rhodococcoides trifolii]|uniref:Amino acid permease n=1 Tax=Rhodococcoides trifolii TaxID=908250 RepID=A0A917CKC7_9NOCA|nr:amino acid permease [Rhodococcus trifolii]GGF91574.1 amino acid permease [Rhodococcus trifolii]